MKRILLIGIFVLIFLGKGIFAAELQQKIEIAAEDQACTKDSDCTVIETSCLRLACDIGEPVNVESKAKYEQPLQDCRQKSLEAAKQTLCEAIFHPHSVKCIVNRCEIIMEIDAPLIETYGIQNRSR